MVGCCCPAGWKPGCCGCRLASPVMGSCCCPAGWKPGCCGCRLASPVMGSCCCPAGWMPGCCGCLLASCLVGICCCTAGWKQLTMQPAPVSRVGPCPYCRPLVVCAACRRRPTLCSGGHMTVGGQSPCHCCSYTAAQTLLHSCTRCCLQAEGCGPPEVATCGRDGAVRVWDVRQQDAPVAAFEPAPGEEVGCAPAYTRLYW